MKRPIIDSSFIEYLCWSEGDAEGGRIHCWYYEGGWGMQNSKLLLGLFLGRPRIVGRVVLVHRDSRPFFRRYSRFQGSRDSYTIVVLSDTHPSFITSDDSYNFTIELRNSSHSNQESRQHQQPLGFILESREPLLIRWPASHEVLRRLKGTGLTVEQSRVLWYPNSNSTIPFFFST